MSIVAYSIRIQGNKERMIADHLTNIEQFDADLWKIADGLRANANLASNEYFMPILGLLFRKRVVFPC